MATTTSTITVLDIIKNAIEQANQLAEQIKSEDISDSNGSEAWQAVKIYADGRSNLGRDLKKAGIEKDYYWGWIINTPIGIQNYKAEEAWTNKVAGILTTNGIKAGRVERLL